MYSRSVKQLCHSARQWWWWCAVCVCAWWGCCCCRSSSRPPPLLLAWDAAHWQPNNSRLTRKIRPSHTERMASAGDASYACPKPSPAPHLPEGVYNKCNVTRYHKHTLSCSGPRKESERPQWSPCGGGNDGCGGLGATRRQHQRRGGDDDIRPAAQLCRLLLPAVPSVRAAISSAICCSAMGGCAVRHSTAVVCRQP